VSVAKFRRLPSAIDLQPLLLRIAAKDPHALAELYDATARQVFGILRRMLWSGDSAGHVAEQLYARVWNTAHSFDPDHDAPWPWLALLTRRLAIERMREDGGYPDGLDATPRDPPAGPARSAPAARVEDPRRAEVVRGELDALPGDQRRALELTFFGGLSQREIADRIGTSPATVAARIRAALLELSERLDPEIEE
jgi:RNA polymerase sigma-70 factor (ECF subfamily)